MEYKKRKKGIVRREKDIARKNGEKEREREREREREIFDNKCQQKQPFFTQLQDIV